MFLCLGIGLLAWNLKTRNVESAYKPHGYQAVFLTNGQVYFGTVQSKTKDEVFLSDIYYLQSNKNSAGESNDDVNLVKLGNELHGPENSMLINRNHVVFIENLRDDSKVVKAIQGIK